MSAVPFGKNSSESLELNAVPATDPSYLGLESKEVRNQSKAIGNENYKGFVAGCFSGITKLAG